MEGLEVFSCGTEPKYVSPHVILHDRVQSSHGLKEFLSKQESFESSTQ